jgi:hypothetical protein
MRLMIKSRDQEAGTVENKSLLQSYPHFSKDAIYNVHGTHIYYRRIYNVHH